MIIKHSSQASHNTLNQGVLDLVQSVDAADLRSTVETIAIPRHYCEQQQNNRWVGKYIYERLQNLGYDVLYQGLYHNIVALPRNLDSKKVILVGAHYDSVPGSPGADDNASAVASLLNTAQIVAAYQATVPICFVAFNREEDGLIGSMDFINNYLPYSQLEIQEAHILEMVGYCDHKPDSQRVPKGLPINLPKTADFLGLIGNKDSNKKVDQILSIAKTYLPNFPVIGLKVMFSLEKVFSHLRRSDHAPFWEKRIPTLMWTDTSEFRNPNYHKWGDTPESLDYNYMRSVTQLLILQILLSHYQYEL